MELDKDLEDTPSYPPQLCHAVLPDFVLNKHVAVRASMGVVCSLSIIGSLFIIFSYVFFKNLRTRARYILVHLSVTDLVLALSNLVGLVANFDAHNFDLNAANHSSANNLTDTIFCKVQGFLTLYSTLSSVLWTVLLALLVYILVTAGNPKRITKFLMWSSYILCYGLPLLPTIWALLMEHIGSAPLHSAGWCTLKSYQVYYLADEVDGVSEKPGNYCVEVNIFTNVFAYNIWIVMAFAVIVITYLSVHCHITNRDKMIALKTDKHAEDYWEVMANLDNKFAAIPAAFVLIRIWCLVSDIVYIYIGRPPQSLPSWLVYFLLCSLVIGNSAQGLVDAVIFVAFTQQVRRSMLFGLCRWLRPKHHSRFITDKSPSINSYKPCKYQYEPAGGLDNTLDPTTSATSYPSYYYDDHSQDDYGEFEGDDED